MPAEATAWVKILACFRVKEKYHTRVLLFWFSIPECFVREVSGERGTHGAVREEGPGRSDNRIFLLKLLRVARIYPEESRQAEGPAHDMTVRCDLIP